MELDEEIQNEILDWFCPRVIYSQHKFISNIDYMPNDSNTLAFIQSINNTYQAHRCISKQLAISTLPCELIDYVLDFISYCKLSYTRLKRFLLKGFYDSIDNSSLELFYPIQISNLRAKVENHIHRDINQFNIKYNKLISCTHRNDTHVTNSASGNNPTYN